MHENKSLYSKGLLMKKNTIIDGIAASEHLDSSGESLSIEGMDISSLGGPDSILNWEHGSKDRPSQVVGKVTFAKKIMKKANAKTKREKYFWNKIKKPFVYIKAELFDGIGHSGAQDVAAMLRYKNKDKGEESRLVVGFSIEGGKMDKKGMVVTKSIARDVAITVKPCNKVCDAELIEDNDDEDFLYKNQDFDCEILEKGSVRINTSAYRDLIMSEIKKSTVGNTTKRIFSSGEEPETLRTGDKILHNKTGSMRTGKDIYNDPKTWENTDAKPKKTWSTDNSMRKALVAGMMAGSPDSLSGGAALAAEELVPEMQNVSIPSKKKVKKLKKNEDGEELFLQHYSTHKGLKSIDPNKMGSGIDRRTQGRSTEHKFSFYYPHNYENPEHQVKSGAKSKYTVKVPGGSKIYDSNVHGSDMINQAKAKNQGIFTMDHFLGTLKENGYHGFKSNPNGIKMVGMFHDLPIHSEEEANPPVSIKKNQPDISFPQLGIENNPRMQVKTLDRDTVNTNTLKPDRKGNPTVSQADLEARKIVNKRTNRVVAPDQIKNQKQRQKIQATKEPRIKSQSEKISPENGDGLNYGTDASFDLSPKQNKEKIKTTKGKGDYRTVAQHESLHGALGALEEKFSPEHRSSLVNHIFDKHFDAEDTKLLNSFVDKIGYEKGKSYKEEMLTHAMDLTSNPEKRDIFNALYSHSKGGKLKPDVAQQKDWDRMNRIKQSYLNAQKEMEGLTSDGLNDIHNKARKPKKRKEVQIQRIAPGVSGTKR